MDRSRGRPTRPGVTGFLTAPRARRVAALMFVALVALIGGGARGDIISLIVLRPLSVLFAGYALLSAPAQSLSAVRGPLLLLGLAIMLIAWQLVPLPPSLWQALPGRDHIAELDALLGIDGLWRTASLSPSGSWNALFALAIPAAALLLFAALEPRDRPILLTAILLFAGASALLGVFQLLGSPTGPLYFYAITNGGEPVGLFANRNHQAIFLAACMPIAALWIGARNEALGWRLPVGASAIVLFLLICLLSGSRAGALLAIPAVIVAALQIHEAVKASMAKARAKTGKALLNGRRLLIGMIVAGVVAAGIAAALVLSGVVDAKTLTSVSDEEEIRLAALPTLFIILGDYWLLGTGGGAFPIAYQMYEPTELLGPTYLNHAHNDWLEVPIEYGVAGVLVLLVLIWLVARTAWRIWLDRRFPLATKAAFLAPWAILAVASLVDYPLRTPSLSAFAALWLAISMNAKDLLSGAATGRGSSGGASVYPTKAIR